jgi:hypothetical protein
LTNFTRRLGLAHVQAKWIRFADKDMRQSEKAQKLAGDGKAFAAARRPGCWDRRHATKSPIALGTKSAARPGFPFHCYG